jgi:deoxyribodipyrimidine photo-lyase
MTVEDQERSGCRIGLDYPSPIVDHQRARQEYLDLGKAAKVGLS